MIKSILDSDLYKFTMQAAVLGLYPHVQVSYEFINRNLSQKFNKKAYYYILESVRAMAELQTTDEEIQFLRSTCSYLPEWYYGYLRSYRFNPNEVTIQWDEKTGAISIKIEGLWVKTILWEVPLLAIISEAYFECVDTDWKQEPDWEQKQRIQIREKGCILSDNGCTISDFGTRRRRCFKVQEIVVEELAKFSNFVGTSNPYLAMKFPKLFNGRLHAPKGTVAHEWTMAHEYLGSILHCNRDAMAAWQQIYKGKLGIALTDTLGSAAFFNDIDELTARYIDGVRHDSGPYKKYVEQTVAFFKKFSIDPLTKVIIFSDGLDVNKAIEICKFCVGKVLCSFGIGTFFTNDFGLSEALKIVIKLRTINEFQVVKTSDDPGKETGDWDAIRVVRWIVNNIPLDSEIYKRMDLQS